MALDDGVRLVHVQTGDEVTVTWGGQAAPRAGGVGGVADHVDPALREARGEQIDEDPGQLRLARPLRVWPVLDDLLALRSPQPEQHR